MKAFSRNTGPAMHRLLFILWLVFQLGVYAQPRHLYLTWDNPDTAHTQTIVFQTVGKAANPHVEVKLDGAAGQATVLSCKTVMLTGTQRRIHRVTLTGLEAKTLYQFRAGDSTYGMTGWKSFRTLPTTGPVKIVTGGDMYRHPETVQLLQAAARHKPDVALIGGDIAYADADLDKIGFWDDWFDNWADHLDSKNGPMVPMICAIGNHEVGGAFDRKKTDAPYYFAFFPQGGEAYFHRKLSQECEVVVLDSSHVTTHQAQVPFLTKTLASMQQRDISYRLALYHVPCYPTHRPANDPYGQRGRKHWVPLFDRYALTAGLENHDHTFKRTHPLKANKVTPGGTVYLGDGCWGRTPRTVDTSLPYLAKASSTYHVWMLTTEPGKTMLCEAVGRDGKVFDRVRVKARAGGQ